MENFFRNLILRLFGRKVRQDEAQIEQSRRDNDKYIDISSENITALIAGRVANLAFGDSQLTVTNAAGSVSAFSSLLADIAARQWAGVKRDIACGLGSGMIVSIPYSVDNGLGRKIYIDTVTRDRFYITASQGSDVTQCVVLADKIVRDRHEYKRWTDYSIDGDIYSIRSKATKDGAPCELAEVEEWAAIPEEIQIGGVTKLPIAIFRCPQNPRRPGAFDGVPITFGCDATLDKIKKCLEDIEREFDKKKAKIFADRALIRNKGIDDDRLTRRNEFENNDLFVAFNNSDRLGVDIFDPAFRETSYYTKLTQHFAMLEKECGLSEGVLTKLSTGSATATEIRRAMYDTFCFCDDVHTNFKQYFDDLMYSCAVLLGYYGLAPYSEYKVEYSWSYAMLEDPAQTFSQLMQAESIGAERTAEIRRYNHPEETLEEAQAVIDEIAAERAEKAAASVAAFGVPGNNDDGADE